MSSGLLAAPYGLSGLWQMALQAISMSPKATHHVVLTEVASKAGVGLPKNGHSPCSVSKSEVEKTTGISPRVGDIMVSCLVWLAH